MKRTICTSQYSRLLSHNHRRYYNPQSGERDKILQKYPVPLQSRAELGTIVDNPRDDLSYEVRSLEHPEVHTYHFRMEMARAIWRNYRHGTI